MTGAQIVDEFLRRLVSCIDVQEEELRLLRHDQLLCLAHGTRNDAARPRDGFLQGGHYFGAKLLLGLQNQHLKRPRRRCRRGRLFRHGLEE